MQNHTKDQEKHIEEDDTEHDIVICHYCKIPKTGHWYCYICGYPYNNDDCDD